jgi:hypothetical protein
MADDGTTHVEGNIIFPCCDDPENLERTERLTPSLIVRYCRVCGRRHFEATAEPGTLGLRGASL